MVKKGKKKKKQTAASTLEQTSDVELPEEQTSQQQKEPEQTLSEAPGSSKQFEDSQQSEQAAKKKKKKKQTTAVSTSEQTSDGKSQEQALQQEKEQEQILAQAPDPSQQKQQKPFKDLQLEQTGSSQQKIIKGPKQQVHQSQQQQGSSQVSQAQFQKPSAWGSSQQVTQGQPQKPPAWGGSQQVIQGQPQQPPAWGGPRQQIIQDQPQQPSAWSVPRQQITQGQPQQPPAWGGPRQQIVQGQPQQPPAWGGSQQITQGQPQQPPAWGGPRQQIVQGQPQQPPAWGGPRQQVTQGQPQQPPAWGGSRQQVTQGQPQQPPAWGGSRQQVTQGQPQQPPAWGGSRQQVTQGQPQQPPAWGGSRQQVTQGQPQQPPAWGGPRQQILQGQPQQQRASEQPLQKTSTNIGAAGDRRQVQAVEGMHQQQPSTSTASYDISGLTLTDPFHSQKLEKSKMTSDQLKLYHEMIPKRVNPMMAGSKGQKIVVFTNMFQIIFNDKFVTNAVHYDIDIIPFKKDPKKEIKAPKLPKIVCRNIFEQCRHKHFKQRFPAYDGKKNAYSANDLPFSGYLQDIFSFTNEDGREKQYEITLKKVANIDLSWIKNLKPGFTGNRDQTAIQVLDIIMRHGPESQYHNIGKSLFWNVHEQEPLTGGLGLVRGGFLSGTLGWQPYLNVDVSHKAFTMPMKVLAYLAEVINVREENLTYNDVMRNKFKLAFLKGLKVTYLIPNSPISKRTYRVHDLWHESCDTHTFESSNGPYTITKYFREVKRYNIRRSDLPTLHVGSTVDGKGKVLVPLELCTIVGGQVINKKLNEVQTSNMIKKAATSADRRKERIEDAFKRMDVNRSSTMQTEFHLFVSPEMKKIDARVLCPPQLKYDAKIMQVNKGVWYLSQFNQAKNLEDNSWAVLDLSELPKMYEHIHEFVKNLQTTANSVGMKIGHVERIKDLRKNDLKGITEYFNKNKHLKLIIVVIPDHTDVIYGHVKKITEMDIGVLTQCVKVRTVKASNKAATLKNILQKINSKLNGVNHTLNEMPSCLKNCPCMLVGADVTHPAPDSKDAPSIAAVAASRNNSAFQYNVALRLQPPKEEIILDLEAIILSQLNTYYQETKRPPQRIIYYRDGVSEGQLSQVMYHEITAVKNAIKQFNKGTIDVTCLVVQKRHHVRLFPSNPRESDDRNGNVRAGTIVDTTITHPDHIDFYLVSHASIQGTARPTKYRCICNDSKFSEDALEEMTYYLCHMYARCTRSVSYPAPTYYAHLAAFRGRALLQGKQNFNLSDLETEQRNFKMKMAATPMYFV